MKEDTMMNNVIIAMQNLNKSYGSVAAVVDANLEVSQGEFFGLLGSSGSGKTTLLRMLAGFESPTSGTLNIDGQPMSDVPAHKRPVNMVFQSYAIFPHLNIRQNIGYGLRKDGLSKAEQNKRIDETLEMIQLSGFGERHSSELSGGQRQRVALARALIKKPKVLLLDEPLGALDKNLREKMQLELRQLQRSLGITFILVTHDQEEALTMSDRIAVMSEGRIVEVGSPTKLYERSSTHFVAEFLGEMNFFNSEVLDLKGDQALLDTNGLGKISIDQGAVSLSKGARMQIGIRPENMIISSSAPDSTNHSVEGTILNSSYLGDRSHLHVEIKHRDQPVIVSFQNQNGKDSAMNEIGQKVFLEWTQNSITVFSPND